MVSPISNSESANCLFAIIQSTFRLVKGQQYLLWFLFQLANWEKTVLDRNLFSLSTAQLRKIRGKKMDVKNWWKKLVKTSDGFVTCTSFSWWGQVWWKWHTVLVCVLWSWHLLWHAPLIISPRHSQGSDRQPLQQPDHSVRFDQFYFTYQDVMSISENVRLFFSMFPCT